MKFTCFLIALVAVTARMTCAAPYADDDDETAIQEFLNMAMEQLVQEENDVAQLQSLLAEMEAVMIQQCKMKKNVTNKMQWLCCNPYWQE